jgi:hypothetical protein
MTAVIDQLRRKNTSPAVAVVRSKTGAAPGSGLKVSMCKQAAAQRFDALRRMVSPVHSDGYERKGSGRS